MPTTKVGMDRPMETWTTNIMLASSKCPRSHGDQFTLDIAALADEQHRGHGYVLSIFVFFHIANICKFQPLSPSSVPCRRSSSLILPYRRSDDGMS
mmetsp:Transcript_38261/g.92306  ORF Transcript_38261/g.92306 Transcript_38261/m.92306 type:complete len:96 (-) Transcript_38261:1341-1628(-)